MRRCARRDQKQKTFCGLMEHHAHVLILKAFERRDRIKPSLPAESTMGILNGSAWARPQDQERPSLEKPSTA